MESIGKIAGKYWESTRNVQGKYFKVPKTSHIVIEKVLGKNWENTRKVNG